MDEIQIAIAVGTVIVAIISWIVTISLRFGKAQAKVEARFRDIESQVQHNSEELTFAKNEICEQVKEIKRMLTTPEGGQRFMTWGQHDNECVRNSKPIVQDINRLGDLIRDLTAQVKEMNTRLTRLELAVAKLEEHK